MVLVWYWLVEGLWAFCGRKNNRVWRVGEAEMIVCHVLHVRCARRRSCGGRAARMSSISSGVARARTEAGESVAIAEEHFLSLFQS